MNFGNGALPVPSPWTQNPCRPWERLGAPVSLSDRYGNVIVGASAPSSRCCPDSRWCGRIKSASNTGKTFSEAMCRGWSRLGQEGVQATRKRAIPGHPQSQSFPRAGCLTVGPSAGGLSPAPPPSGPQAHAAACAPWAASLQSAAALPHSGTAPHPTAISNQRPSGRTH